MHVTCHVMKSRLTLQLTLQSDKLHLLVKCCRHCCCFICCCCHHCLLLLSRPSSSVVEASSQFLLYREFCKVRSIVCLFVGCFVLFGPGKPQLAVCGPKYNSIMNSEIERSGERRSEGRLFHNSAALVVSLHRSLLHRKRWNDFL